MRKVLRCLEDSYNCFRHNEHGWLAKRNTKCSFLLRFVLNVNWKLIILYYMQETDHADNLQGMPRQTFTLTHVIIALLSFRQNDLQPCREILCGCNCRVNDSYITHRKSLPQTGFLRFIDRSAWKNNFVIDASCPRDFLFSIS